LVNVAAPLPEVQDRIAHQLSRPVIGDVPAPADPVDADAQGAKRILGRQNVGRVGAASEGQHGGMLQKQEGVRRLSRGAARPQALLQGQGRLVIDPPQHLPKECPLACAHQILVPAGITEFLETTTTPSRIA
jgi:hypothetical protein